MDSVPRVAQSARGCAGVPFRRPSAIGEAHMRAEPLRRPGDGFVGRAARYDRRRRMTDARGPKPMSPSERALKRIEAKVSRLFENANQRIDKVEASVDLGNKAIADQLNSMFLEQRQILGETRDS